MRRELLLLAPLALAGPTLSPLAGAQITFVPAASAQPSFAPPPPPRPHRPTGEGPPGVPTTALEATADLRAHVGVGLASRLVRSSNPEDRLRGLERAAADASSEAVGLLVRALDPLGAARTDSRALLAVARGLALHASEPDARIALEGIVHSPPTASRTREATSPSADDPNQAARVELARSTAAFALASSSDPRALDAIVAVLRGGGAGQSFAADALAAAPPGRHSPLGPPGLLGPAVVQLTARLSDLRTLDAVRAAARLTDVPTRAAALRALAQVGDTRAAPLARASVADPEPQVRIAAAEALVALGAPEGARAVQSLLEQGATALEGARLAETVQDEGVVRALAARAAASRDTAQRVAAVSALG